MKKEKEHKYKKGQKLVIEIAEAHTHWADDGYPMSIYRIKGFASLVLTDGAIDKILQQEGNDSEG